MTPWPHDGEGAYWLELRDTNGEPVLALPLILRREMGLAILSNPDLGVSDYNPPLLGRPEIIAAHAPEAIWTAIRAALPPADLLRLKRMPPHVGESANPLVKSNFAVCARTSGWVVDLPDSWDDYIASLTPKMREKLGKCRRRFLRQPGAAFKVTEDVGEALHWLNRFDALQRERIEDKGVPYILDREPYASFYRALTRSGLPQGRIAMAALLAGDDIVASEFCRARRRDRALPARGEPVRPLGPDGAGPPCDRAPDAAPPCGWRAPVRFRHGRLRLQAPVSAPSGCRLFRSSFR